MLVDRMHTEAIKAADASMLPMTVYRVGNEWFHADADRMTRFAPQPRNSAVVLVVTWLPDGFFDEDDGGYVSQLRESGGDF